MKKGPWYSDDKIINFCLTFFMLAVIGRLIYFVELVWK